MVEKIKEVHPPTGLARLGYRLPILLYRLGMGSLLGTRFLLLTHTGRKTGKIRQTVLEVVRYDKDHSIFIVTAGFGRKSDWYRNIQANPRVKVQSGGRRWDMQARFLTTAEGGDEMLGYARRYPKTIRKLASLMGYRLDGSEEDIRALGELLPLAAFEPADVIQ